MHSESFSYLSSGVIEIRSFLDDVELKVAGVKEIAFQDRERRRSGLYANEHPPLHRLEFSSDEYIKKIIDPFSFLRGCLSRKTFFAPSPATEDVRKSPPPPRRGVRTDARIEREVEEEESRHPPTNNFSSLSLLGLLLDGGRQNVK